MTHRACQIIDAVADAIKSTVPSNINVYAHRRESLAEDQDELPAISVDFGEDEPIGDDGSDKLDGTITSLLTVNVSGLASDIEESLLRRSLLQLRTHAHVAIKRNKDLGLPFVLDTHYGGANPPDVNVEGDTLIGELTSVWGVRYELRLDTPE